VTVAAITDLDPIAVTLMVATILALLASRFVLPFPAGSVPFPLRKLDYHVPLTAAQCEQRLAKSLARERFEGDLFRRRFLVRLPGAGRDPLGILASGTIVPTDTGCRVMVRIGLHGGFFFAFWLFAFVFLGLTLFGRVVPEGTPIAPLERALPAVGLTLATAFVAQWLVSKFVGAQDVPRLEQLVARELQDLD
jgi:hypothetical protein